MEKTKSKWRNTQAGTEAESLLETYYSQLMKWGAVLTRGDKGMAQDIVHDLCLHFTLAKPDLSQVANLDGYLYTCLRNIYLSALARSSREATQFVSVAEFDSIHFALNTRSSDILLQRQNDLRRICSYTLWRKESSKSASYLILLFFHGYCRREVAEIACLPIAGIYNKLKIARAEVKSYLEGSGKLRVATREIPPEPDLRLSPVSFIELFSEFRETILHANSAECIPVEALLSNYQSAKPKPISCSLLSHIVSCQRCLTLIDRHFRRPTLEDREPPEDFGAIVDPKGTDTASRDSGYGAMMRIIGRQRERVYEHRPRTLSIAVNGKITAFHDVQGERSALASRIENPENAQFVEVFTEQQVRLALLPIGDRPPEGSHVYTQRVSLSDDRWLELVISFDGLGLHTEVTYFDPALAVEAAGEATDDEAPAFALVDRTKSQSVPSVQASRTLIFAGFARYIRAVMPRPALAWAVVLGCVVCVAGYFVSRYARGPLDANEILSQSIRVETTDLLGQTEHQILQYEEATIDGHVLEQATIDLWKEGNSGRYMRRLYNGQHRLIAAEWRTKDGKDGVYTIAGDGGASDADRELATSTGWREDVSTSSFRALASRQMQIRAIGENYEVTSTGMARDGLHPLSATLVLDHQLRPVSETLQINSGSTARTIRLVQVGYERRPASSVPNTAFDPDFLGRHSTADKDILSPLNQTRSGTMVADLRLVQMQIAALYQLGKVGADTGEPIEVTRTPDGHIRVSGTVADDSRKQQISTGLNSVPDHQLLEIRLVSQSDLRMAIPSMRSTSPQATNVYSVGQTEAPAAAVLRKYFAAKGWTGERVDSAVAQFSQSALGHAQRALQHAYALDRLGSAFTAGELKSVSPASQRQWAEMAARHATALETEVNGLDKQLAQIAPAHGRTPQPEGIHLQIDNPGEFARAASQLLRQTQNLNRSVGNTFASGPAGKTAQSPDSLVADALQAIPLQSAAEIAHFASHLADSEKAANSQDHPSSNR
jgi:DNA-directed RNA polymerase specialized sigma24 family protein